MIKIQNLEKTFGANKLFDNVNFNINTRERVGLIGRNGHGKTTLIKILIGQEHADSGIIDIPKDYIIGYVSQHLKFSQSTVLDEASLGLGEHDNDQKWKAEKILSGLGFNEQDMQRSPSEFSGGFQVRINLARILVSEPNLLLLDEPTNYLDITSIRWLSNFLKNWPNELILITHDRSFMDDVITHSVIIHRAKVKKIKGNTEKLYEQIAKEEEIYEKTRINDEKKKKEIELFINRFRAKARLAGMVQSRVKNLQKMEKREKLTKVSNLEFTFNEEPFEAKNLLTVNDLSFGYEKENLLIKDFNYTIKKDDRICIIGKNGKGKTTLLKLLAGALEQNTGEVIYHPKMKMGFFAQTNKSVLEDNRTVEQEIAASDPLSENQQVRNICGSMMFQGDDALKKISVLSGGEKSRVMLGKILLSPTNILLLDEPTNHLDMQSCDSLLEAVDNFNGAVLIVTHNEMFLNAIANRIIVFRNNEIINHEGDYASFLEKIGWDEDIVNEKPKETNNLVNKKEIRKIRSDIISKRAKDIKPLEQEIKKLENLIEEKEQELQETQDELIEFSQSGDSNKIQELSKKSHSLQEEIESFYDNLTHVTDKFENLSKEYEKQLEEINIVN